MRSAMEPRSIKDTFQGLAGAGNTGIIPFITVGFPNVDTTLELVPALAQAGADIIELGVPFSDPLADGATVQKASFHALEQGVTMKMCLEVCSQLRSRGTEVPLVFMGYYNQFLAFGLKRFAAEAQRSGLNGVIVPDLPPEEAEPLGDECRSYGIDLVPLLAPTSKDRSIASACSLAGGFIYCVSLTGVTGSRDRVSEGAEGLVRRVRSHTDLPIAVGFGLSQAEHVRAVGRFADAAIVGSALVNVIDAAPPGEAVRRAAEFISGLRQSEQPLHGGAS